MPEADTRRVAVVTGGTGALGRWVVRGLAEAGMRVHVPRHTGDAAERTRSFLVAELGEEAAGRAVFGECDVTDPESVEDYFRDVQRESGRLDVLVNGVGGFTMAALEETGPTTWRRMMDLNATSAFLCSRAAVPIMKGGGGGRILNVGSMPALERGAARMSAYAASKAALLNLTRSLSKELVAAGITVNAVVPSVIDTPDNRKAMPDADRSTWLKPAEIARVVGWLAGEDAGIVNGAAIPLSRG